MFNNWQQVSLSKLQERYYETQEEAQEAPEKDPVFNADLKKLKAVYAILTGDNAKNTYGIHCKPWLCQHIMRETQTTFTYVMRDADGELFDASSIIKRGYEFVHSQGLAVRVSPGMDTKYGYKSPPSRAHHIQYMHPSLWCHTNATPCDS